MAKLADIHTKYGTDKGTDHSYIDTYDSLFQGLKDKPIRFLEVGVLFGESLKMWHEYFTHPESVIVGLDDFSQAGGADKIKEELSTYNRIQVVQGDSTTTDMQAFGPFDVIIDDGDHTVKGQFNTLCKLFPLLKKDGIYIIEDISGYQCMDMIDNAIQTNNNLIVDTTAKHFYKNGRHDDALMIVRHKA